MFEENDKEVRFIMLIEEFTPLFLIYILMRQLLKEIKVKCY